MNYSHFIFQGVKISIINQANAIKELLKYDFKNKSYICFPDSYTIFSTKKDPKLLEILNNTFLTMPDGKPLEFYARRKGLKEVKTVSGFWTAKALLADSKISHYFYGSTPPVLKNLQEKLTNEFPNANILGYKSPPFVPLQEIESNTQIKSDIEEISKMNPNFIWIGISSPKQDYLMAYYHQFLNRGIMLGIGGVFEYLSGDVRKSPEWIKKIGLRWLYRLLKEPLRLSGKYWFVIKAYCRILFFTS